MTGRNTESFAAPPPEIWRAADLEIDVGRQRVTRGGIEIPLPKLSFDLLLALVRRAPDVVSNDDLMSLVWPGLVVGPETIVQRVKLLRQALDDRSADPRYIAALRGRGYRLLPSAERLEGIAKDEPLAVPKTSPTPVQSDRRWQRWTIVVAAVLALGGLAWVIRERTAEFAEPSAAAPKPLASSEANRPAVAVLPFENLSPDPADAYLSRGVPDLILSRLASVQGLTVIARDSSFRLALPDIDAREVGRRLGAAWLVGGSVQRSGDRLRVTARLVDAETGTQLWSDEFGGEAGELFDVQDRIAEQVAQALGTRVAGLGEVRPPVPRSNDFEANLAYLRGRVLVGRFTVAEAEAAAAEFQRAVDLDPAFAAAFAALYDARMQAAGLRHDNLDEARQRHRPLLERALEIDPNCGAGWFGRAMWEDLSVADREAAFRNAVALDPGNARGLVAFAEFLDISDAGSERGRIPGSGFDPSSRAARVGGTRASGERTDEAGRVLEQALRLDPLSPRAHFRLAMRGVPSDPLAAETAMLELLRLDPDYYPALQRIAKYRWLFHDRTPEAIAVIERAVRSDPQNPWAAHTATALYLDVGDPVAAREVATTTPASARTTAVVLAAHDGDWRAAGEAAMTPEGFEFGFNESWLVPEALRDYALQANDYERPRRVLAERYELALEGPIEIRFSNYRAAVPFAHIERLRGRDDRAREILRAVVRHVDSETHTPPVYKRRSRALALMLLGEEERALADLAASFRDDRDYTQWWYALDRDPVWGGVRDDPRFQALAAEVRAHAARDLDAVETLRAQGQIPRRAASASSGATGS